MLKKIILPLVLLIFTQQEFYSMEEEVEYSVQDVIDDLNEVAVKIGYTSADNMLHFKELQNNRKLRVINNWVNKDLSGDKKESYPKLWWLWTILDNIIFQYGGSKIWKHGVAYYGLSNGIGFFPSVLNFGWLKVGIVDAHINVINLILDFIKNYIQCKNGRKHDKLEFIIPPIGINLFFNIHIISFRILNCIKIKLVAPLTILLLTADNSFVGTRGDKDRTAWYITYNTDNQISWWYALLSPRIELNIPEL